MIGVGWESREVFVTTWREVERTCMVCGHTDTHTTLLSTGAFGPPDLDTRPAMPARVALPMQIQCCPSCGYCAPDVSEGPPVATAVVAREDYQAQRQAPSFTYLANMFLCWSMIQREAGDYAGAGWAAVRAAWACDDGGAAYAQAAIRCRLRAVALFTEAQQREQPFAAEPGAEEALLADLLRRSGRFAEAETVIGQGLARRPSGTLQRILCYQRRLCRRRDASSHTIAEALGR